MLASEATFKEICEFLERYHIMVRLRFNKKHELQKKVQQTVFVSNELS
ncbi:hypothetical protein A3Q56_05555 [Intoshia linei]|uniref:Uncharacterized protein n=1 Tax=Intoshia linei TaxID=1819745 RepID=A0A177AXK3_9BILA|nr:hypothetical protein A3Q56_05555 [Intoshia linei]